MHQEIPDVITLGTRPLKVTFFNYVPNILVYCSNPSHFHQKAVFSNIRTIETLARHSEKHFFMTVRMKKTRKFKNNLKSKNSSSEKDFRKFRVENFRNFQHPEISKNRNMHFSLKIENFDIFSKIFENFRPRKFRKYFSDEEFFDFKIFLNILVFSIRTVIKNYFSLCLANPQHLHTFDFIKNNWKCDG